MKRKKAALRSGKRNSLLNFLKGCACIGVVFIHIPFPGLIGVVFQKIAQCAVPIFVMISGYFAYSVEGDACSKVVRRAKRIGNITICAIVMYLIYLIIIEIMHGGEYAEWLVQLLNWKQWFKIVVFSDFDVIRGGHLWFLPSLIYAYVILFFIDKRNLYRMAYRMMPVLFLTRIVVCTIVFSMNLTWHLRGNFLIGVFPWFLLGNYIADNKELAGKFSNEKLIGAAFAGLMYALVFVVFDFPLDLSEIGILVWASSLFLLAIKNPAKSISKTVEKLGDIYALYVYIIHIAISSVVDASMRMIGWDMTVWYQWARPMIVALVSIIGSMVIYHFINNIKLKAC